MTATRNIGWKVAGALIATAFGLSLVHRIRRQNQDKLAAEMLRELKSLLQPESSGLLSEEAFDVGYAQKTLGRVGGRIPVLSAKAASDFAREIHESWSFWGDDEERIYSMFRQLKDKIQVSQVAAAYQENYGRNLIDRLNARLGPSEIQQVLSIVNPLPPYRNLTV